MPGCEFCTGKADNATHNRKSCPVFINLTANASRASYVNDELLPNDNDGFAAAGFCLFTRGEGHVEILMAREVRNSIRGLNFLGGRRYVFNETPIQVASNRASYDVGKKLRPEVLEERAQAQPLVLFSAKAKYVLFFCEITKEEVELDGGPKELLWKKLPTPLSDLHKFVKDMILELANRHEKFQGNLENLGGALRMLLRR